VKSRGWWTTSLMLVLFVIGLVTTLPAISSEAAKSIVECQLGFAQLSASSSKAQQGVEQALRAKAATDTALNRVLSALDEYTLKEISRLTSAEAERVLRVAGRFNAEERLIFQQEIKKPTWRWCK
jgi:pectate lyase